MLYKTLIALVRSVENSVNSIILFLFDHVALALVDVSILLIDSATAAIINVTELINNWIENIKKNNLKDTDPIMCKRCIYYDKTVSIKCAVRPGCCTNCKDFSQRCD